MKKFIMGTFIFLLCVGMIFNPVNTKAALVVRMHPGQSRTIKLPKGWKNAKWSSKDAKTYNIRITVGDRKFSAVLDDNETVRAFLKKLPMTITMNELNGNEKYYYFSDSLPKDSTKPKKIHTGDLMLYGSDCLVLFYEDFSTSYSYTPLGRVSNPDGLAEALGSGNVKVAFSLE